jgi:cation:H+ antiporter
VSSLPGLVLLVAGLVLVVAGAELFVAGLLPTAARLGISPYAFTLVVSGLEMENLAAGIALNTRGLGNAAAGTFLGGTTFLALAVPGLAAVLSPLQVRMPFATLAWTAVAPLPLFALGIDGRLSRIDGAILVVWFAVALTALVRTGRGLIAAEPPKSTRHGLLKLCAGLLVLTGAGDMLAEGVRRVVRHLSVSPTLLGNAAIAPAVELEEVGRVAVPTRRGRPDVAVGNVLGTIVHFAALNAGIIALVRPIHLDHATRDLHLPVAGASALMLAALLLWRRGLTRGDGVGLLLLYAIYVVAAVARG